MHVVEEINGRLPNIHLVVHALSSVPQNLQDVFNAAGGEMPQTSGMPFDEIVRGIKHGVRKVNIDTDCRRAMAGQLRKVAQVSKKNPRKVLKPATDALKAFCRDRFEQSGTAGNASRIKVTPLVEMANFYRSGKLDPRIETHAAVAH